MIMAKYTTTMRNIIENKFPLNCLKEYPIFDEEYREHLNALIVYHFYTREIAYETPELFHLKLRVKLLTIMPYYNKLYLAQKEYDADTPFIDTNMTTDTTAHGVGRNFDTPKGYLEDIDNYMTSLGNNDSEGVTKEKGFRNRTMSNMLKEIKENYMKIDMMVLEELEPLFFILW